MCTTYAYIRVSTDKQDRDNQGNQWGQTPLI
jgi:DNA invertase Pin-like site-specific DNA recombinase